MSTENPLIGTTDKETVQNAASALNAFMRMLAAQDSDMHFLLLPVQDALDQAANQS